MKELFIQFGVYIIIIAAIAFLAYQQGHHDGMKTFCNDGTLYKDIDGLISCLNKTESEFINQDPYEIKFNTEGMNQ